MSIQTGILAATTLALGVVTVYLWGQLNAERELTSQLVVQRSPLNLKGTYSPSRELESLRAGVQPYSGTGRGSVEGREGDCDIVNLDRGPSDRALQIVLEDPTFQELQRTQLRAVLPQNYPDLAKDLGLTPEGASALLDVLAKHQSRQFVTDTNQGRGEPSDEGALIRQQRALQEEVAVEEAEIAALLGPTGLAKWKDYQGSQPARLWVRMFESALATGGNPLSDLQSHNLVAALLEEQRRQVDESARYVESSGSNGQIDYVERSLQFAEESNLRFLNSAALSLNSAQLEALRNHLYQELAMSRVFQLAQLRSEGD